MGRVIKGGLLRILLTLYSAGNAVVLKPSEVSDHMADLLSTLIPKYMDKVRRPLELRDDSVGGQVFKSRETRDYYSKWEGSSS